MPKETQPRASGPNEPSLRADAARNRQRLFEAAAAEFAEHGMDVSIARIAERAGVGKGTVFRHFETKEHLVAAIICQRLDEFAGVAEDLLDAKDPGKALLEFMTAGVEIHMRDRSFFHVASSAVRDQPDVRAAYTRVQQAAARLTKYAQKAGVIRKDLTGQDIIVLLSAAYQAAIPFQQIDPELWRRYLTIIFDGLRPEHAHRLPRPSPTTGEFDQVIRAKSP